MPSYAACQRPSALARSISARPAGRIRPAAISASTFWRLTFDQVLCGRRGVKRCTNQSSSMRFARPSIQPKHSATSTAPAQSSDADTGVLLGHPDEHLVGVGAVGLQPGLELVGGREELHVHPTAFNG